MKKNSLKKMIVAVGALSLCSLCTTAFPFDSQTQKTACAQSTSNTETAFIGDASNLSFASSGLSKVAGNACNSGATDPKYKWFDGKDETVSDLPEGYLYGAVAESALPTGGKDGGVKLYIHCWDTETLRIDFGKTVNVSEVDGIRVKAYFGISDSIAQGKFYLCSEDSSGEAGDCVTWDFSSFTQNEWIEFFLDSEDLAILANDGGTIDSLIVGYATTGGNNRTPYGYAFLDEIVAIMKNAVTFSYGNGQNDSTMYAFKGETIAYPDNPTRSGYVFGGWYQNGKRFDFSTPVNGDMTLEAKWLEKSSDTLVGAYVNTDGSKYISLNTDGKVDFSGVLATNGEYEVGKDFIAVDSGEVYLIERVENGLLLDGEKFAKTECITAHYYDGDDLLRSCVYPKNYVITPLAGLSTASKKFEGWKKKGQSSLYDFSKPLTAETDFYATYEMRYLDEESYERYYGYYYGETEKTTFILQENHVAKTMKKGMETVGEYTVFTDGTVEILVAGRKFSGETVRDGLKLNGREYKKLGDYALTFENGAYSTSITVKAGEGVTFPDVPDRKGYTFKGWQTADGEWFDSTSVVFRSETLIAQWSKTEEKNPMAVVLPVIVGAEAVGVLVAMAFVLRKFLKKREEK